MNCVTDRQRGKDKSRSGSDVFNLLWNHMRARSQNERLVFWLISGALCITFTVLAHTAGIGYFDHPPERLWYLNPLFWAPYVIAGYPPAEDISNSIGLYLASIVYRFMIAALIGRLVALTYRSWREEKEIAREAGEDTGASRTLEVKKKRGKILFKTISVIMFFLLAILAHVDGIGHEIHQAYPVDVRALNPILWLPCYIYDAASMGPRAGPCITVRAIPPYIDWFIYCITYVYWLLLAAILSKMLIFLYRKITENTAANTTAGADQKGKDKKSLPDS